MNYRMLAAAAAISISALGSASCSDDDPAGPTGPPTTFVFTSTLSQANEVPAINNADASASGTCTTTLTVTRDSAGSITAATIVFVVNVTGFTVGTNLTAAHIHNGAAGVAAGVYVDAALGNGTVTLTNGAATFTRTAPATTPAQADAIILNPAGFYFNLHSTLSPGGAIRGQLVFQSSQ